MEMTISCKCGIEFAVTLDPVVGFIHKNFASSTESYKNVCECPDCGEMYMINVTSMGEEGGK